VRVARNGGGGGGSGWWGRWFLTFLLLSMLFCVFCVVGVFLLCVGTGKFSDSKSIVCAGQCDGARRNVVGKRHSSRGRRFGHERERKAPRKRSVKRDTKDVVVGE
jgi:hypothetical protein